MQKYISIVLQIFFSIIIFLLSSKAGIISLIFIYLFYILFNIFSQKKYKIGLLTLVVLIFGTILLLKVLPFVKDRFTVASYAIKNNSNAIKSDGESNADRIIIWGISVNIIKQNLLFGVGTGDVKDVLLNEYKRNEIDFAYKKKLNAHNQYLQTFIALGLPGIIVFLLCFLLPIIFSIKHHYYLYLMFLFLFAFNILVESMFENQAGVVFYALMNSFLFFSRYHLSAVKSLKIK
jgi:O-antigen ligase